MVNSSDFGKRLQVILDYYQISASELSNQINFNRSTISHLLSGRNKPSLDFVMKILQKYPDVELYWLLNGKGDFPKISNKNTNDLEKSNQSTKIGSNKKITSILSENDYKKIDRIVIFFEDGTFKSYNAS